MRFLIESIKHPKELGTFIESWPSFRNLVLNELKDKKSILELGAGTGPISREILKKLPENGFLRSIEVIPGLYHNLEKIKDPRFEPILGDAKDFSLFSQDRKFDCILSGLPLTIMDKPLLDQLLNNIKEKKISFIQYKYKDESDLLKEYFKNIRTERVWKSIPFAVVHVCNN